MILEGQGLTIGYRDHVVGRDLDVALRAGEVLALLGPNGGGKTTLLKTLLGLLPPLAGEVRIEGHTLSALPVRERARKLAYVPQNHAGAFAFTVSEIVMMGRTAHRGLFAAPGHSDQAVVRGAIDRMGIGALGERPYTMISGGERQLALIARALAQEPRAIVLDEPTASLDFGNQGKIMREIRALAGAGLAVLFTTHDPNQAYRYADRALLLRDGRCFADGAVADVLTRDSLQALYQAPVEEIGSPPGGRAFLPG
jgi:iron complex transport system ATP-binding protein